MALKFIADVSTDQPVSKPDAKCQLRIDHHHEDERISDWIKAARQLVEIQTRRQLLPATWEHRLDRFPSNNREIEIRRLPLRTLNSLKYIDTNGVQQTLDSTKYIVDDASQPARICPAYNEVWPATRIQPGAVIANFEAGYDDVASVPAVAKQAILLIVGHWYMHREAVISTGAVPQPVAFTFSTLVNSLRW